MRPLGPAAILVILVVLVLALVWAGQRRMIYFPFSNVSPPAAEGLNRAEEVTFTTEDGLVLHGWFVPPATMPPRFTVIVFNGNAGNRSMRAPLASALAEQGVATFLFDYRGFGDNPGRPSESGLTLDARAARIYVAGRPDVDSTRVVYFGESLGGAVAVRLATEASPLALVLRSPFSSLTDIGRHHYPYLPVRWMLKDRYPSIDLVPRLTSPILIIAGDRDGVIPMKQSQRLFDAAPEPKRLVTIEGADHNDYELFAGRRLIDEVLAFVSATARGLR
jgi:fermentation-respiration switch protein FrsA (DUF1100 family)